MFFFASPSLRARGAKAGEDRRAQLTGGMIKDGRFSIIHRKPYFLDPRRTTRTNEKKSERKKEIEQ